MSLRTLYFVRNAHYTRDMGHPHGSLTPTGQHQANLTAQRIAEYQCTAVICSTYRQMIETARSLAIPNGLPIQESHLLRQYDSFALEDGTLSRKQFMTALESQKTQLSQVAQTFIMPAGDTQDTQLIVCHGNIIRDLICTALGINPANWSNRTLRHCSVSILTLDNEKRANLVTFDDTSHLPTSLLTE
jgi:serine/threonine-protein phosphatase PGAM5